MRKFKRLDMAGLLLGVMLSLMSGITGAIEFASSGNTPCAGNLTIAASGVSCSGAELLSTCTRAVIIDSAGKISCPASPPDAPTIGTATSGNAQATVTFTAPANNGGAAITGYTVKSSPDGITKSGAASPITVTGLTNGRAYTFTVTATNSGGSSAPSAASNSVTPNTKISQTITFNAAPTVVVGSTGTVSATGGASGNAVTFTVPTTTSVCTVSGSTITGVAAGTCTIAADQAGNASYSAASQVTQNITVTAAASASGPPNCTINPGVFGNDITVAANCTPSATSYVWSANTGLGNVQNGHFAKPITTTSYYVTGSNAFGSGSQSPPYTYSVSTPIPACTLAANPGEIDTGGASTLTATCNPLPSSYTWTGGTCAGNATNTCNVTPASTTAYSVTATNVSGTSPVANATVTVQAPNCTLAASPSSVAPNGSSTLTATCKPIPTGGVYHWTGGGACAGVATNTCDTGALVADTPYTVYGINTVGTGNTASLTVTVAKPTCTLSADQSPIVRNGSTILRANCIPAADTNGHVWTGGACVGVTTSTCNTGALAATTAYTVQGTNAAGTGAASSSYPVTVQAPNCALAASPSSVSPGGSSTLTATCTPLPTNGYTWTGGACAGNTTGTCNTGALASDTPYTVTGNDSVGPGNTASTTVTVLADPGCPSGYTNLPVVPITWVGGKIFETPLHSMGHCEVRAFSFTAAAGSSVIYYETNYANSPKYISISENPYEFSAITEANGCAQGLSNNPSVNTSTTGNPAVSCQLTATRTYYVNVRNSFSRTGADSCAAGASCTFYLSW